MTWSTRQAVPTAATARRPPWAALPIAVRDAVESAAGGTVTRTVSQDSGFTPGFASRAISMHGDGLDAGALLADAGVAADDDLIDVFLATLLGYFARARQEPVPDNSPYLRAHQAWYADVVADWLRRRQGW